MLVWIDCELCLPEFNVPVMTKIRKTNQDGSTEDIQERVKFRNDYGLWYNYGATLASHRPTHWSPL